MQVFITGSWSVIFVIYHSSLCPHCYCFQFAVCLLTDWSLMYDICMWSTGEKSVKDKIFLHMAVKDKNNLFAIHCLLWHHIFQYIMCSSSDQKSVLCLWPHLHLVLRHKAIPSCPFFAFAVWCWGAEATLFIPVLYLMLVVSATSEEHKLQHSAVWSNAIQ
jgi:hypothetical protein